MDIFEIKIDSEDTLMHVFDVLHDATCDNDDIKYDEEKRTLDIIFNREFFEDPSKMKSHRVFLMLYRWEFPIVKSHIHLEGLKSCNIYLNANGPVGDMFNKCGVGKDKYVLYFCMGSEIEISFEKTIKGYLRDLEFIEGKKGSQLQFWKIPKL